MHICWAKYRFSAALIFMATHITIIIIIINCIGMYIEVNTRVWIMMCRAMCVDRETVALSFGMVCAGVEVGGAVVCLSISDLVLVTAERAHQ